MEGRAEGGGPVSDLIPELTVRQYALWTLLPFAIGYALGAIPLAAAARRYKRLLDEACAVLLQDPEMVAELRRREGW